MVLIAPIVDTPFVKTARRAAALAWVAVLVAGACGRSGASNTTGATGATSSTFCEAVRAYNGLSSMGVGISIEGPASPAEVEAEVDRAKAEIERLVADGERIYQSLRDRAPDEVRSDLDTALAYDERIAMALRAADFAIEEVAMSGRVPPPDAAALAAVDRVDAFTKDRCGTPYEPPWHEAIPRAPTASSSVDTARPYPTPPPRPTR